QPQMEEFYDSKLPFKNQVLNHILAIWILAEALPWNRIEDSLLRLAFWYARRDVKLFGRTWVAREA
ncbi:hypothetical protein DFH28DRAFT_866172, partial [Melampsora americana]